MSSNFTGITADDLKAFANQNGFLIHPAKPPETWAEAINSRGGACSCSPDRTCPCPESIDEIRGASRPKDQKCACVLFVTKEYLDAYGYTENKINAVKNQQKVAKAAPAAMPAPAAPDDEVDRVLKGVVTHLEKASAEFDKLEYDNTMEALATAIETSGCHDFCEREILPEITHVEYVRGLCNADEPDLCKEEQKRFKARLTKLIGEFREAINVTSATPSAKVAPAPATQKTPIPSENLPSSSYHDCQSKLLKSPELADFPKQLRFYISTKICSGKADSIDAALDMAADEHPEWFAEE